MTAALRSATEADVPDIMRLVRGLAEYERMPDRFTATAEDYHAFLFGHDRVAEAILAEVPGRAPVGVALFYRTVNTFAGRTGLFLEDLYVEPDLRGQGIGLALLRRLAEIAVERGHLMITWSVLNWNEPSIRFYESFGATAMDEWHIRILRGPALATLAAQGLQGEGATNHG